MSLHWNLEQIEDHESVCFYEEDGELVMHPVTQTLIFMTVAVGMGSITAQNAPEFAARLDMLQKLDGPMMNRMSDDGERETFPLTTGDVIAHIGLVTNVAIETRTKWLSRTVKRHMDDVRHQAEKAVKARMSLVEAWGKEN